MKVKLVCFSWQLRGQFMGKPTWRKTGIWASSWCPSSLLLTWKNERAERRKELELYNLHSKKEKYKEVPFSAFSKTQNIMDWHQTYTSHYLSFHSSSCEVWNMLNFQQFECNVHHVTFFLSNCKHVLHPAFCHQHPELFKAPVLFDFPFVN